MNLKKRFHHKYIGLNGRLDTIQAAILNVKLNYFNETLKKRNECAYYYSHKLQPLEDNGLIIIPKIKTPGQEQEQLSLKKMS